MRSADLARVAPHRHHQLGRASATGLDSSLCDQVAQADGEMGLVDT